MSDVLRTAIIGAVVAVGFIVMVFCGRVILQRVFGQKDPTGKMAFLVGVLVAIALYGIVLGGALLIDQLGSV